MTVPGLHQRLRATTRAQHLEAEARLDPAVRLAAPAADADLLDRLWALHAGAERAFAETGLARLDIDLAARRRSPWIAQDLQAVAGRAPRWPASVMAFDTRHEALGGLYVLEGSSLGGQVLFRQAQARLGVTASHGGRFFHGHGARTGRLWREFLAVLAGVPAMGREADEVEAGARATFSRFIGAFPAPVEQVGAVQT